MTYDKASFLAGLRTGLALPRSPKSYLTFKSEDGSNITLSISDNAKHWDGTMYYSTDAVTWEVWDGTTELSSNMGVLHLRGSGNTVITGGTILDGPHWKLNSYRQTRCRCIGNIENLLDWETVQAGQHPQMSPFCYANMFLGFNKLTSAPKLPATTLADGCYSNMFIFCDKLTSAPKLPATTLRDYCYQGMFSRCTSLTSAPKLPATTTERQCYANMFFGCTNLTSAPELPATTMKSYCYYAMFSGCTNLTNAPELPATELSIYCYDSMFWNCTSLTSAPELPATELSSDCYSEMFHGCTSLTSAPKLPATTLVYACYDAMFSDCTNLTSVPELPATTMQEYCYRAMFANCTSLKLSTTQDNAYQYPYRIPTSGSGTIPIYERDTLTDMFKNTGGPFTGTPGLNVTYYTDHPPIPAE